MSEERPILEWKEPPPLKVTQDAEVRDAIVAELKRHPGQWAVVEPEAARPSRVGRYLSVGCEAKSRRISADPPRWQIFARWPR